MLKDRRMVHLNLSMFKQTKNVNIVNKRDVRTRAHDAPLFKMIKPNNEKYKRNVYYKGAISWNSLPVMERHQPEFTKFKNLQNINYQ